MIGVKGFPSILIIIYCYYLAHFAQVIGQTLNELEFHCNVYLQASMCGVDILSNEEYNVSGLFKDDIGQENHRPSSQMFWE